MLNKRVLLTGITGFIGGHVAARFLQAGWDVSSIIRTKSDLAVLPTDMRDKMTFHNHDKEDMRDILREAKPEIVIHLASCFISQHTYEDIDALLTSNVIFGTKLLDAMKEVGVTKFINTGTSWQHFENKSYSPVNLYAASKQAFEDMVRYYEETVPLKVITLKLFDTYGQGDRRRKLLAILDEIAKTGDTLKMSPGEQKIDLVHVEDVAEAFFIAANYLAEGRFDLCGTYAVTSGNALPLRELVARYEKMIKKPLNIVWGAREYRPREVMVPWNTGKILPGWERGHRELM